MADVTIELPSVLHEVMRGQRALRLQATTIAEALQQLVSDHPQLQIHLFDESGGFREHVLCFHNKTNTRWLNDLDVPLADGDVLRILQAVSGG